ncbi:hypothetical protein CYMTET_9616 [Cymbomonas tetramitiformis]|uniref:Uncharacterized protein n=1 Tax=Cymbomonas tetramitiformis TaxID=36881 RepID=A0AAE0GRB6_9CHLO|nr:hypothetical protein CYMTET_9616 [Cymbomonas tetramitiformis]
MEQKIYAGTEGMVADTVLTKWLAEFDNSKAKNVMTATAKQAAGAASRAQRNDHRVGGGRGGDRAPPPNSPGQTAYDTGVCTLSQRSMARWGREQRSTAMDRSRSEGTNSWRLVMDFRWLNEFCVKSKCKMETLKKLRRLASQGD